MKILFLDQYSDLGGGQQCLLDTLEAVQRRGWQAHVLMPGDGPLCAQLSARNVPVNPLPCGPYRSGSKSAADAPRFLLDLPRQVRAISKLTRHEDFDLIYVNGPRLLPAVSLARPSHTPVLFHAHSHVGQAAAARLAGWSIRRTGATVASCSHSVLEPLRRYQGSAKLHVVPSGVRDLGYRQRVFGRGGAWRIGMLGRIAPEKGQLEFLRAAALLRGHLPRAWFVICGATLLGASGDYAQAVRAAARGLSVEFESWQEDVGPLLGELDLLVVPSLQEGMGRVVVEAFAAGVPVIAFPSGGIPEAVTDGETGFLTREISSEALATRIHEVTSLGQEQLRHVAANARRAWQRSYTVAAYQARITALMETVVSAAPAELETEALPQPR